MSKRILVKEAGLLDFFKSFFKAKSQGTESEWLQRLRKSDPKLADIWTNYDDALSNSMATQYKVLKSSGLDTTHIEKFMKQYGIKQGKSLY
jgi:hypothetical protein